MLIDSSYFRTGPRRMLNSTLGSVFNPNGREVEDALMEYVSYYQEPFLTEMLGERIGNKIHLYLVCKDEGDNVEIEDFEKICNQLKESFADYVFYKVLRDSSNTATLTGTVKTKNENQHVSPALRQKTIWNRMVDRNRRFEQWAKDNEFTDIIVSDNMLTKINTFNI